MSSSSDEDDMFAPGTGTAKVAKKVPPVAAGDDDQKESSDAEDGGSSQPSKRAKGDKDEKTANSKKTTAKERDSSESDDSDDSDDEPLSKTISASLVQKKTSDSPTSRNKPDPVSRNASRNGTPKTSGLRQSTLVPDAPRNALSADAKEAPAEPPASKTATASTPKQTASPDEPTEFTIEMGELSFPALRSSKHRFEPKPSDVLGPRRPMKIVPVDRELYEHVTKMKWHERNVGEWSKIRIWINCTYGIKAMFTPRDPNSAGNTKKQGIVFATKICVENEPETTVPVIIPGRVIAGVKQNVTLQAEEKGQQPKSRFHGDWSPFTDFDNYSFTLDSSGIPKVSAGEPRKPPAKEMDGKKGKKHSTGAEMSPMLEPETPAAVGDPVVAPTSASMPAAEDVPMTDAPIEPTVETSAAANSEALESSKRVNADSSANPPNRSKKQRTSSQPDHSTTQSIALPDNLVAVCTNKDALGILSGLVPSKGNETVHLCIKSIDNRIAVFRGDS